MSSSKLFNRLLMLVPSSLLVGAAVVQYRNTEESNDQLKKLNSLIDVEEQHQKHHLTVIEDIRSRQSEIERIAQLLSLLREQLPINLDLYQQNSELSKFGSPLPQSSLHHQLMSNGLPSGNNLWFYDKFIVSHNLERRIPNWVIQRIELPSSSSEKQSDRKNSNFTGNVPQIPVGMRADNKDYLGSGWSRGHMVPASDMSWYPQEAMNQTFLLNSNIVPQNLQNNANFWYRLEVFCKSALPKRFDAVTVVSGPLFRPNLIEQLEIDQSKPSRFPRKTQKTYMKYEVLGENKVAVPTHLFKVIMVDTNNNKNQQQDDATPPVLIGAFIVPNEPIGSDAKLIDYQVSLDSLERETGLQFFNRLEQKMRPVLDLCEETDCTIMSERELDVWNIPRRIGWSKNKRELERVIEDAKSKNIELDSNMINEYNEKLKQLDLQQQQQQQISTTTLNLPTTSVNSNSNNNNNNNS